MWQMTDHSLKQKSHPELEPQDRGVQCHLLPTVLGSQGASPPGPLRAIPLSSLLHKGIVVMDLACPGDLSLP